MIRFSLFYWFFEEFVVNHAGWSSVPILFVWGIRRSFFGNFEDIWIENRRAFKISFDKLQFIFLYLAISLKKMLIFVVTLQTHLKRVVHSLGVWALFCERNSAERQIAKITHSLSIIFPLCMWASINYSVLIRLFFWTSVIKYPLVDFSLKIQVFFEIG